MKKIILSVILDVPPTEEVFDTVAILLADDD
jgi:hypothetical protein